MPQTIFDDTYQNGILISRIERIISDIEIERSVAGAELRSRLPLLRVWGTDAKTAAELTAMTPADRIIRQAQIETRVAMLSRLMLRVIWRVGEDDGV